ncbi:MAG TPA: hypothetical protein VGL86_09850 [Polyangia bacterium]|jgi:hypothetical protein
MLTKIGVAALLGTIGTAAVGGTASAAEPCRPVVSPVAYRYHDNGRRDFRVERVRREEAFRHAAWLRGHDVFRR